MWGHGPHLPPYVRMGVCMCVCVHFTTLSPACYVRHDSAGVSSTATVCVCVCMCVLFNVVPSNGSVISHRHIVMTLGQPVVGLSSYFLDADRLA